jgi:hypothetical protein
MDRTAKTIGYLVAVHVLGLLALTACRLVLLFANAPAEGIQWALACRALLIGVKFDNLIASYIVALPAIVLPVLSLCMEHSGKYAPVMRMAAKTSMWWFGILYTAAIFIGVANARYFHFFENHLNISVTEWFGFAGDTAGLVFGDAVNWVFLGIAVVLIALYLIALRRITNVYQSLIA